MPPPGRGDEQGARANRICAESRLIHPIGASPDSPAAPLAESEGTRTAVAGDGGDSAHGGAGGSAPPDPNGERKACHVGTAAGTKAEDGAEARTSPAGGRRVSAPSSSSRLPGVSEERALVADWFTLPPGDRELPAGPSGPDEAPAAPPPRPLQLPARADLARRFGYIPPAAYAAEPAGIPPGYPSRLPVDGASAAPGVSAAWALDSGTRTTPVHMAGSRAAAAAAPHVEMGLAHQHPYSAWHHYQWQLLCQQQMHRWWADQLVSWQQAWRAHEEMPPYEPHDSVGQPGAGAAAMQAALGPEEGWGRRGSRPRARDRRPEPVRGSGATAVSERSRRGTGPASPIAGVGATAAGSMGLASEATEPVDAGGGAGAASRAATAAAAAMPHCEGDAGGDDPEVKMRAEARQEAAEEGDAAAERGYPGMASFPRHPPPPHLPAPSYPLWLPPGGVYPPAYGEGWARLAAAGVSVPRYRPYPGAAGQTPAMPAWQPYSHPTLGAPGLRPPGLQFSGFRPPGGVASTGRRAPHRSAAAAGPRDLAGEAGEEEEGEEGEVNLEDRALTLKGKLHDPSPGGDSSTSVASRQEAMDRKMRRLFPSHVTAYLKDWLEEHVASPYPSDAVRCPPATSPTRAPNAAAMGPPATVGLKA